MAADRSDPASREAQSLRLDVLAWMLAFAEGDEARSVVCSVFASLPPAEVRRALVATFTMVAEAIKAGDEGRRVNHPLTPRELLLAIQEVCRKSLDV